MRLPQEGPFFFEKNHFFQNLLGRPPGGSRGSFWACWWPVWLGNAHRWSSWAYFRRPGLASDRFLLVLDTFGSVLDEFGLEKSSLRADFVVFCPKMDVCSRKMTFFVQKWTKREIVRHDKKSQDHPRYTQPSRRECLARPTRPYRGPPGMGACKCFVKCLQLAPIGARKEMGTQVLRQSSNSPLSGPARMGTSACQGTVDPFAPIGARKDGHKCLS